MATLAYILALCVISGAHSYVLLSASLDDVHSLAQQIVASPVANALIRRASAIFNHELRARNNGRYRNFRKSQQSSIESTEDNGMHNRRHLELENVNVKYQNRTKPLPDRIEEDKTNEKVDDPAVTLEDNQDKGNQKHAISSNEALEKVNGKEQNGNTPLSDMIEDHMTNQKVNDPVITPEDNQDKGNQKYTIGSNEASEKVNGKDQNETNPLPDSIEDHKTNHKLDDLDVTQENNQYRDHQKHTINSSGASENDHENQESSKKLSKTQELVALGKNASLYLDDIRKIIEKV